MICCDYFCFYKIIVFNYDQFFSGIPEFVDQFGARLYK